jgi:hypothetical protein
MPTSEPASANTLARTAGLLYLVVVLTGTFYLGYVPTRLAVHGGDTAAWVAHLVRGQALIRWGIAAELVCHVAFLLLPLALYRLLAGTGKTAAVLMVAFAVAGVPIAFANVLHKLDLLTLLGGADYLQAFTRAQLNARVMLELDAYRHGLLVLEVFWGLWLAPLGWLVFRSGFLPRVLGVLLVLGCLGYLVDVLGTLLLPSYPSSAMAGYVTLPASLGEIGICLWLLLVGVRARRSASAVQGTHGLPLSPN